MEQWVKTTYLSGTQPRESPYAFRWRSKSTSVVSIKVKYQAKPGRGDKAGAILVGMNIMPIGVLSHLIDYATN
jgi:hypothetical protein